MGSTSYESRRPMNRTRWVSNEVGDPIVGIMLENQGLIFTASEAEFARLNEVKPGGAGVRVPPDGVLHWVKAEVEIL